MNSLKNTGIEWIPYVKPEWKIGKVKDLFYVSKELATKKNPIILSLARSAIRIRDISNNEGQLAANYDNYNTVQIGDLLLNPMDLYSGANCNVSYVEGVISPAYSNLRAKTCLEPRYFDFYFKIQYWTMAMFAHGKGVSFDNRWTLNNDALLNYEIPIPSYQEQKKIVEKLDYKITLIDKLITNQEKQIVILNEYKQSTITKAVSKGLRNDDTLKETNIVWIGKIPERWETIKIKYTSWLKGRIGWDGLTSSEFVDEGPYLITGTDFFNGEINWNTCVHISEERFQEDELLHIKENDLLITKDGTIGKLAIATKCPEKVSLNSGVMIIRNTGEFKYLDKYLYYVLQSNQFNLWYELSQSGNSTIRHLYQGQFYNFEFTYPSLDEQKEIAYYLDRKCSDIDALINMRNSKIDKLNEYKKSLIYEYVTGKKQVL